jgi:hypothetical protein
MLTCVALTFLGAASFGDLSALAVEVEAGARELTAQTEITPAFLEQISDFSGDSERLSIALRQAGVEQDLPCIFHGIAEDARERIVAFTNLRVLLDDAILIAPMAASAAADEAAEHAVASR